MAVTPQWAEEIPLIEEHVDTGLSELLAGYQSHYILGGERKDDLSRRFTLYPQTPIPTLDHPFAKAYHATDDFNKERSVYAMVCEPHFPYRHHATQEMIAHTVPHLTPLLGAGVVRCSHLNESRYVMFFERPQGRRLSDLLKTQPRFHEHQLIDYVLQPAVRALLALREKKISYGNICPEAFFFGETTQLLECYSMPSGSIGHYVYEPLERLMCHDYGHGEAHEKADCYALGILAFEMMYGVDRIKNAPKDALIRAALDRSTYHLLTHNRDFPEGMQDLFRGLLNENPNERWGLDQLNQWIGGKRFNMISPSLPKEAVRPFLFAGENFTNRRLLAHMMHLNWREAAKDIKGMKLDRWCEVGLHRPDVSERVERALRLAGEASTERHVNDMMTRIIAILDPAGSLRTPSLTLRPDAIPFMFAAFFLLNDTPHLTQVIPLLEFDVANYWVELADMNRTDDIQQFIWKSQRIRPYLKDRNLGFGVERILYEMNPSLACQSELLRPYHILNASDFLHALDAMAHHLAPNTSFVDRHMAAFLASKIDLMKPIKLNELQGIPSLMNDEELIMLKLLGRAQQKLGKEHQRLLGLSTWAAMRIEKMLDQVHNRVVRRRIKLQLKKLAATGNINDVLVAIVNEDIASRDYNGFANAIALHQINQKKIDRFTNPMLMDYYAKERGGKIATLISYTLLSITTYLVFNHILTQ